MTSLRLGCRLDSSFSLCNSVSHRQTSCVFIYRTTLSPFFARRFTKHIAKRLSKAGVIEHFNFKNSIFTLSRRASGDCQFLDAKTRRCTVYEQRPNTCRLHPQVGPRPNYCPYGAAKKSA
jgi:Fe-S-cluster containining protein